MPRPELKPENLSELVRQAVFLERNRNPGLRFDLTLPEDDIILICDSRQIAQVLTNLLKNASEAIEESRGESGMADQEGTVWVTVNREASDGEAERVAIVIADNGCGLPVDCRDRLTEPYVTSRAKGTGLGLAIVKKITEDHNADLIFEDRENGGARVKVIFHGMEGRLGLDDKSAVRSFVAQSPRSGAM
jgi:two-component system nitrogen regulation sensor histidine kinase NtrY